MRGFVFVSGSLLQSALERAVHNRERRRGGSGQHAVLEFVGLRHGRWDVHLHRARRYDPGAELGARGRGEFAAVLPAPGRAHGGSFRDDPDCAVRARLEAYLPRDLISCSVRSQQY